jgi:hypothetical protein
MAMNPLGAVSVCQLASWKVETFSFSTINPFLLSFPRVSVMRPLSRDSRKCLEAASCGNEDTIAPL